MQDLDRVEDLGDDAQATHAGQAGAGEDDCVHVAGADQAETGVDVASDRADLQTQPEGGDLCGPPR